ncbi:MAG: hypothetical protein LBB67_00755 [Oscillospiraceae bacterium]|jgi:hypothetical protein|nr:hypothetical protein [Oscillospiraceae bacterium]
MASYCPNPVCNYRLKLTDWKPICPKCGVNVLYYKMEERLLADADRVEAEHAVFQKRFDRFRASLIGSKLAIARLALLFLPIAALFLPLAKIKVDAPFFNETISLDILGFVGIFDKIDVGALFTLLGVPALKTTVIWTLLAIVGVGLVLFSIASEFVNTFFASTKNHNRRVYCFALVGLVGLALGAVAMRVLNAAGTNLFAGGLSAHTSIGAIAVTLALLLIAAINVIIDRKGGVPVKYKECFINGVPADEVFAAQKEGISMQDFFAAHAAQTTSETQEIIHEEE